MFPFKQQSRFSARGVTLFFYIFTLGYCSEKTKKNQAIDATRQHKRPEKASDKLYLAYIYIANSRP